MRKSVAYRELESAGWTNIRPVEFGSRRMQILFEAFDPDGAPALVLKQSSNKWHVFFTFCGTASDSSPERAHKGGLGDAIDTDSSMRVYQHMIKEIPNYLCDKYWGLRAAKEQAK